MPISSKIGDVILDAYNDAKFIGFKRLPSGDLVGLFSVKGLPQQVTKLYREPLDLDMLNELRIAAGLVPLQSNRNVILPDVRDRNKLGYDKRMQAFLILKDSGYYDIAHVRHIHWEPEGNVIRFDPNTGEVLEYGPEAA